MIAGYEEIAAQYDISADDYVALSDIALEDEVIKAAQNELIFIKIAAKNGIEYSNRNEMVEGVRDYLLGIIKVSKK